MFLKVGNKTGNTCTCLENCWIEFYSFCLSFQTSEAFLCFSRSPMVNIIYPFLNDFFPTKTSTLLFYNAVVNSRTSEIHKALFFTLLLVASACWIWVLVTGLWPHYLLSSPVWQLQQIWRHNFFPSSHIQYGNSNVLRV